MLPASKPSTKLLTKLTRKGLLSMTPYSSLPGASSPFCHFLNAHLDFFSKLDTDNSVFFQVCQAMRAQKIEWQQSTTETKIFLNWTKKILIGLKASSIGLKGC